MKMVRLLALGTDRLYPSENIPCTHFFYRLSRPVAHSAAVDRTRNLPAFRVSTRIVRLESCFRIYSSLTYTLNLIYVC